MVLRTPRESSANLLWNVMRRRGIFEPRLYTQADTDALEIVWVNVSAQVGHRPPDEINRSKEGGLGKTRKNRRKGVLDRLPHCVIINSYNTNGRYDDNKKNNNAPIFRPIYARSWQVLTNTTSRMGSTRTTDQEFWNSAATLISWHRIEAERR